MKKILFVDDVPYILCAIQRLLSNYAPAKKWDISYANSGHEALSKIIDNNIIIDHYDVVVTDINMPHMDGFELIERVKILSPDTKFIIVSGHVYDCDKEYICLPKPVDRKKLFDIIEELTSNTKII